MRDWIEWSGGECPVEQGTLVDVKYRCRIESTGLAAMVIDTSLGADASCSFWRNEGAAYDIIAYRLHNQDASTSEQPKQDMVNHPPHYQSDNGIECIYAIRAALGRDGFIAYCRGNAMKYIWRDKLDNVEDWNKAVWYLNKAIEAKSE